MGATKRERSNLGGGVGTGNLTSSNVGVPGRRTLVGEPPGGSERLPFLDLRPRAQPSPGEVFEQATRGAGSPVPHRAQMEAVFGEDFSAVQAYTGRGAEMAHLGAAGAAVGESVVFGSSEPEPRLVAHELAHVVQDRRAGGVRSGGERTSRPDDPAEREATEIAAEAERALAGDERGAPRLAERIRQTTVAAGGGGAEPASEGAEPASEGAEPASEGAEAARTEAEQADPAREDAAAAQADTARADAARAEAASADAARTTAPTIPEAAPHDAGRPPAPNGAAGSAKYAEIDASAPAAADGAAPVRPRMPGVEALGALSNLTPSNLAQAVREADRSLTLGAQATRSAIAAKTAAASAAPAAVAAPATAAPAASAASAGASPPAGAQTRAAGTSGSSPSAEAVAASASLSSTTPPALPRALEAPPQPAVPAGSGGVSAGPRPRVDLTGPASPAQLDHKRGATAGVLGSEVLRAHEAAATAPAAERPPAPRPAPPPPPPIEPAPIAVEEPRFLASVPPPQRPAIEAAVAPAFQRRVTDVQARIAEAQRRGDERAAQIDARHQAAAAQRQATAAGARAAAQGQVDQTRRAWQAENVRVQGEHQRRIDEHQARAQEQVAALVETGEREVDASLTRAETEASGRLTAAQAQAQAMIAAARERTAAAQAQPSGPVMRDATGSPSLSHGGPEDNVTEAQQEQARELLEEVMRLNEEMLAAAQAQNGDRVAELRDEIEELLAANKTDMDTIIHDALENLPIIGHYYQVEIAAIMASVDAMIGEIENAPPGELDERFEELAATLEEQQGMLSDITQLASYTSVDDLAADFRLSFTGNTWDSTTKEVATLGAVLTERALRDAAPAGQVGGLGFGDLFQDVMGPIAMNNTGATNRYGSAEVVEGGTQINWDRNVTTPLTKYEIDSFLGLVPDQTDGSLLHHVIHELGHVFDNRARMHGRIDTYAAERGKAIPEDGYMRNGMSYGQHKYGSYAASAHEEFGDLFLNFVVGGFKDPELAGWFQDQLYGDTSPSSVPQDDWGWVDIARDNGAGSQWVTYEDTYFYENGGNLEDAPVDVAAYFGITYQELLDANPHNIGDDGELIPGRRLIIPGVDRNIPRP